MGASFFYITNARFRRIPGNPTHDDDDAKGTSQADDKASEPTNVNDFRKGRGLNTRWNQRLCNVRANQSTQEIVILFQCVVDLFQYVPLRPFAIVDEKCDKDSRKQTRLQDVNVAPQRCKNQLTNMRTELS